MKRLTTCDLISICPNSSDGGGEFQTMLDGGDEVGSSSSEKKRRLSAEQVKALEKNFEVENKLEPDRKLKLAEEVGLQPRQVAVWFQNRRARWKTKQLERDYAVLKANHDALSLKFEALHRENQSLNIQIEELRSKLNEEVTTKTINVKKEPLTSGEGMAPSPIGDASLLEKSVEYLGSRMTRDGPSDSDSSAILNEGDNNNSNSMMITNKLLDPGNEEVYMRVLEENAGGFRSQQMVKAEEHDFFAEEESCTTFFSDDQPPCLNWYCSDSWN